jgi:hypothetical protein
MISLETARFVAFPDRGSWPFATLVVDTAAPDRPRLVLPVSWTFGACPLAGAGRGEAELPGSAEFNELLRRDA